MSNTGTKYILGNANLKETERAYLVLGHTKLSVS